MWLGVIAVTLLAGAVLPREGAGAAAVLWAAVAGELLAGACLYVLIDRKVFRPAEGWRRVLLAPGDGAVPADAGALTPLAEAVAARHEREQAEFETALRESRTKLRHVETLRRDLEETKAHLEAKIHDLHSIYEASTAIAGTLETDELFRAIGERAMRTLGLNDFCILLYNSEKRRLTCRAVAGSDPSLSDDFSIAPGEGVSWRVFETGEPVYIPDVRATPEFRYYGGRRMDVRSFMCVPLLSKGKAIGVLNVNHPEPNAFDAESLATMRVLATHMAIAIENAEMFQFVKTLADKDSLTLLYNHGAFHAKLNIELERAARYGRALSVIMLDLDSFKEINDTCGHIVGDRILVMTAGVLCAHLRKSDVAARYGGDEFAVILPETDLAATATIAGRIAAGISQVRLDTRKGEVISFSASIGYAACQPDSKDREGILNVADRLMYESKRRGHGGILGEQL
ncbi:MAG: diguanylate cyclase [Deltaproteobacteria bacterium]